MAAIATRFRLEPFVCDAHRKSGWTADTRITANRVPVGQRHLHKKYQQLKMMMLDVAGSVVCLHLEEDIEKLLSRGEFFRGYNSRTMKGQPSSCHSNSCCLWRENQDKLTIVTGYGLSRDGIWRQHSWCVTQTGRVIETTTKRVLYFGFKMTLDEARAFSDSNW